MTREDKVEALRNHYGVGHSAFKQAALELDNSDRQEVIDFEYNKIKPKEFEVFTISKHDKPGYQHWAKGLTMYIKKDGHTMELNSEEVQKLVRALPRTMGGTY